MTALVVLAAIAALIGLGFGCCWTFIARSLGKRADESARRAEAEAQEAGQAGQSLVVTYALLTDEQKKHAAAARRIKALEQQLRTEQENYEQDRRAWERSRDRFRKALRQARQDRNLVSSADSSAAQPDGAGDDSGERAAPGTVTVVRLRLSHIIEDAAADAPARGGQVHRGGIEADGIRLLIEYGVAIVPRDQAGNVDEVLEKCRQARDDAALRDSFIDAASEYVGGLIGDRAFEPLTQWWQTQDVAGVDAVAQALNRSDEFLHEVVGCP